MSELWQGLMHIYVGGKLHDLVCFRYCGCYSDYHQATFRKTSLAFARDAVVNQDMDGDWCETDL